LGYWLDQVAAGQDVVVTRRGKPMVRLTSAAPAPQPLSATEAPPLVPTEKPPLGPTEKPPLGATGTPSLLSAPAGEAEAA
jgi:prevent-host-death family protein